MVQINEYVGAWLVNVDTETFHQIFTAKQHPFEQCKTGTGAALVEGVDAAGNKTVTASVTHYYNPAHSQGECVVTIAPDRKIGVTFEGKQILSGVLSSAAKVG